MATPKLRFKEFGGDWTKVSLDKVSKVFDGTHQTPNYVESGIKFVSVENIHAPYDSDKFITEEAFKKDFKNQPQLNDILMTRITAGEIGATAIVDDREPLAYYVSLALIRPKAVVTTPFLNQYIGTPFFKNELHKRIIHVAFPKKINLGDINECLVSLPDKQEEQTKIASFLSAVDEKISQLTQKHELLSQYKQGMMQKLFSQQIRFKADDGSEFGEWEVSKFDEVLSTISIRSNQIQASQIVEEGDIPVIDQGQKYIAGYTQAISKIIEPKSGLIIFGDHTTFLKYVDFPFVVGADGVKVLEVEKNSLSKYVYYYLCHNKLQPEGYKRHFTILREIEILVPCLEEQTKIANFLSAIDQKIKKVAQQIEESKQWKKGLLQQMFV